MMEVILRHCGCSSDFPRIAHYTKQNEETGDITVVYMCARCTGAFDAKIYNHSISLEWCTKIYGPMTGPEYWAGYQDEKQKQRRCATSNLCV